MPIRKDVKEVIDLVTNLGLEPVIESGSEHYKVRDPKTQAFLFGISSTPSDPNWRWMIMRHLRRLGYLRDARFTKSRTGRRTKQEKKRRAKPAIDLAALKAAQVAAEAAGERIPTLDDLEDSTEFFTRIRGKNREFSEEAQEEMISIMAATADAPRVRYVRQRLEKLLDTRSSELEEKARKRFEAEGRKITIPAGRGARAEFVRIAINEVASKRGIRAWKSEASGQQTLTNFLGDAKGSIQVWAADLLEATMDHIDGLKWNEIDESRKKAVTPAPETAFQSKIEPESEPEPAPATIPWQEEVYVEVPREPDIRTRYAEALLDILKSEGSQTSAEILNRLDKLAGIS